MKSMIDVAVPLITFLLLFATGLELAPGDLRQAAGKRWILLAGLIAPPLLLPLLAIGLIRLVGPPEEVAIGLLLIAVAPIGGISNIYSLLARASVALSLALTAISCALAPLTLPAATFGLELALGRKLGFHVPVGLLALQLVAMLALPVALGMATRAWKPEVATRHPAMIRRVGLVAMAFLIALVVISDFARIARQLPTTVPLAAGFVIGSFALGGLVGRVVAEDRRDRFTLAAEFATRNLAVATAIAVTLLGRVEFAGFASTYFLVEMPILLVAGAVFRSRAVKGTIA